ncbi:hypothetical protein TRVL_03822 [Trypanosoma vivax]|nr:hypothetical protein TRVL_03822 [Trypanosoma vivax]
MVGIFTVPTCVLVSHATFCAPASQAYRIKTLIRAPSSLQQAEVDARAPYPFHRTKRLSQSSHHSGGIQLQRYWRSILPLSLSIPIFLVGHQNHHSLPTSLFTPQHSVSALVLLQRCI